MKLRSYLKIGISSAIALTILLALCVYFLVASSNKVQETLRNQVVMTEEILDLEDVNADIVTEARYYTYNGEQQHLDNYNALLASDPYVTAANLLSELEVTNELTDQLLAINDISLQAAELEATAFKVAETGNLQTSQLMLYEEAYVQVIEQLDDAFVVFSDNLTAWNNEIIAESERDETTSLIILVLSCAAFIAMTIFILLAISRKLRPLYHLTTQAGSVANGDLTTDSVEVKMNDEIGELTTAFNEMVASLRQILTTVNHSSHEVAASAEQLLANAEQTNTLGNEVSNSIQTINNNAKQQLVQMQENSTALTEVTTGIVNVATAAEDVTQSSADAKQFADVGQVHLTTTVQQMEAIQGAVHETLYSIQDLTEHSSKIEQFVSAIRDISDQTNLLALNASIEAARAGEAGKGFAVVADEVRKLAEQSNVSAEQVSDIIRALQQKVVQTSGQMQLVTTQVEQGVEKVSETGRSFAQIVEATTSVSDQMMNVSAIAQQMSASAEEMTAIFESLQSTSELTSTSAVDAVAVVTRQDAAIEEITSSSNNLTQLADTLNKEVAKFKL